MILDCFTFFNELDLLELRLHTLSPYVDYFVLSESTHTFQGNPKPLYFHDSRSRFRNFESKIIHVPVQGGMLATKWWSAWEREAAQRRAIRSALLYQKHSRGLDLKTEDVVLLSDVDEIPDLKALAPLGGRGKTWDKVVRETGGPVCWVMDMTYYWVDLWVSQWWGTVAMTLGQIDSGLNGDFQALRGTRGSKQYVVNPGGWHFSFLGGVDAIKTKIEAFSHTEYRSAADERNIRESLGDRWKQGIDLFGRDLYKFRPLAADERKRLPGYLTGNRARFSGFFMPDGSDQETAGARGTSKADT